MTHEEFRAARARLGLTAKELGQVLDLPLRTIQRYETDPALSTARKVHPTVARAMRWLLAGYRPPEFPKR